MRLSDKEMSSTILANIIHNEWYSNKVMPYVQADYFDLDQTEKLIAETVINHHNTYNCIPTIKEIVVVMKQCSYINTLDQTVVDDVLGDESFLVSSKDWLIDETERFIKRKRVADAFAETFDKFEKGEATDDFSHKFEVANSFCFDNGIGHGLLADAHTRWEDYTKVEAKIKTYLHMLDLITDGGFENGTLNCILAGTGVGKSMIMGDIAAKSALNGLKVLVVSLEMKEIKLAERVEANLMDVPVKSLKRMTREEFTFKQKFYLNKLKESGGEVYFKQYPTKSANAGHIKNLLIEYKNKLDVEFDLVVVDYLNICASISAPKDSNTYTHVKSVAEELRALAIEFDFPILTATQTNKAGQDSTDLTLDNVSESHGLSVTVDLLLGAISHPDYELLNQLLFVQLKNRYGPLDYYRRFVMGINRNKMQLYDLDIMASDELNSTTIMNDGLGDGDVEEEDELDFSVAGVGSAKIEEGHFNIMGEDDGQSNKTDTK